MGFMVGDDFAAGRRGGMEVRGTKYEVKKLGATEMRGHGERRQDRNDEWELNPCTREVETLLVRRAGVTRMEISIAAFSENFIGTGAACRICPEKFSGECRNANIYAIFTLFFGGKGAGLA